MKATDKIRELVNSLTPPEKGYIKKYIKTELEDKRASALERLFDKEYLERPAFTGEPWMFDFIMLALEDYHKNDRTELRGMLNQIDVLLVDKDLPDQAEKLIQRAKKSAEKSRSTEMLMEISELETALLAIKPPSDALISQMEKTFEDLQELSDEHDSYIFKKIKEAEK